MDGVGSLIVPIVAVFFGALFCARIAGPTNRFGGALHGMSVWGFFYFIGAAVLALAVTPLITSASTFDGSALKTAGTVASGAVSNGAQTAQSLGSRPRPSSPR